MTSKSQPYNSPHLGVPGAQRLDGAAEHDDLAHHRRLRHHLREAAGGRPAVLHIVEAQVEADGLGQQRQQRALLQLVVQDRGVTLSSARMSDCERQSDRTPVERSPKLHLVH